MPLVCFHLGSYVGNVYVGLFGDLLGGKWFPGTPRGQKGQRFCFLNGVLIQQLVLFFWGPSGMGWEIKQKIGFCTYLVQFFSQTERQSSGKVYVELRTLCTKRDRVQAYLLPSPLEPNTSSLGDPEPVIYLLASRRMLCGSGSTYFFGAPHLRRSTIHQVQFVSHPPRKLTFDT